MYYNYGFYGMHLWWWFFWGVLLVSMFSFWTPVSRGRWQSIKETPMDILKRRLANGEIGEQEYQNLKAHVDRDQGLEYSTSPRRAG